MGYMRNVRRVEEALDRDAMHDVFTMAEEDFGMAYDMQTVMVDQRAPADFYHYKDNGSTVLAVAHLDTVGAAHERDANFLMTSGGEVCYSRALDDRLGAYTILELLPALGIQYDILLTVGEESGQSTAAFFDMPEHKEYDRIIEFDRGGTDVVLYDYEDDETIAATRACGARVGDGIFSDISYMEHLGIKGWNWGVGYQDYHGPRAHFYIDDYVGMIARYLKFHHQQAGVYWPHTQKPQSQWWLDYKKGGSSKLSGSMTLWSSDGSLIDPDDTTETGGIPDSAFESHRDDPDFIEYPTLEEIQRHQERLDKEMEEAMARDDNEPLHYVEYSS